MYGCVRAVLGLTLTFNDTATYFSTRHILDDFREAYRWLNQNTEDQSRVMSWWDYGYQIAGMANR